MAGVITFSIDGTSAGFVDASGQALGEMRKFKITAADINAAFAQANAGVASSSAITAGDLKSKSRALSGVASGLALNASMLMGAEAQSVVYPMVLIGKELKTLSAAMKLAGISFGAAAAGGIIAAASIGAVAVALQKFKEMREAQQQEKDSGKDLAGTLEERSQAMFRRLQMAADNGMITPEELKGWKNNYNNLFTGDSGRQNLINAMGARLNALGMAPRTSEFWSNQEAYLRMQRMLSAQAQGPLAAQVEQVYQDAGDKLKAAFETATKAGQSFEPLRDAIVKWRDNRIAELTAADDDKTKRLDAVLGRPISNWERMGAMFTRPGSYTTDHSRRIADSTDLILKEHRRTNALLEKPSTTNSFANQ